MRKLVAVLITVFVLAGVGIARAESNPLLTVFEASEVGMNAGQVVDALRSYDQGDRPCYCAFKRTDDPKYIRAGWLDPNYQWLGEIESPSYNKPKHPFATLEIDMDGPYNDGNAKIVKITYRYKFLKLEKELIKK